MQRQNYSWTSYDAPSRRRAYLATGVVQVVLLCLLLALCFETPLPLPGEEGIAVSFGTERGGRGMDVATSPSLAPRPQPVQRQEPPQPLREEQQLTQDYEEAPEVAVKPAKPDKPRVREESKVQPRQDRAKPDASQPSEVKREERMPEPERVKPTVNPAALFPGRAAADPNASGKGSGGETGNQGSQEGKVADGGLSGQGKGTVGSGRGRVGSGGGDGISYSLGSRQALALPPPEYPTQRSGKVVVKVWVDRQGRVLQAEAGDKGSTTFDKALLAAAQAAAMQAQFDVTSDAPDRQVGSITYVFRLKQ